MSKNIPITNACKESPETERTRDALRLLAKIIAKKIMAKNSMCGEKSIVSKVGENEPKH
jgi:hypothetical protein